MSGNTARFSKNGMLPEAIGKMIICGRRMTMISPASVVRAVNISTLNKLREPAVRVLKVRVKIVLPANNPITTTEAIKANE
ncbi:hypothetical protein MASR1M74_03620 [Lentimicrobium sp.]